MEYKIEDLTKEEAEYIGAKIDEIVPHEVDSGEEELVLKIENENCEIIGGCIAEAYEYHWSRMFKDFLCPVTGRKPVSESKRPYSSYSWILPS